MRMHTETSLMHWDHVTVSLTNTLRMFQQSSASIRTMETPREQNARTRRIQARPHSSPQETTRSGSGPRILNLTTYKFHALADGPATVRRYGTTDSYTTQVVCFTVWSHHVKQADPF
jgi:hypothetical protein